MRKINLETYRERIENLYWNEKLSLAKIAKKIGVSAGLIRKNMVFWEIDRRQSRKIELNKPTREALEQIYYDKSKSIEDILKHFNIGLTTLFRWIREYKINPIRRFKYKKTAFSEDSAERAYLLGLRAGDIHARRHCRQIVAELTTTHPAMIELFFSVFEKYGTPKKYIKRNKITGRNEWRAYILLNNSFDFIQTKNFEIDNEYFYYFLAGFFDCEGCFYIYNNSNSMGLKFVVYNSNKELLEKIRQRLEIEGFHPKIIKCFDKGQETTQNYKRGVDLWAVELYTKSEIIKLMNLLPIKHKEKREKFEIIKSTNNTKWEDISEKLQEYKKKIKLEVQDFIKPIKNERSEILLSTEK